MTTVPSITSPTLPTSEADKAGARLADTFDDFLKLLTTQLQYQDPLEPMDPKDFVDQLTNLTGVEQSIAQNKNLETIIDKLGAGENGAAVSYLGKEIGDGYLAATRGDRVTDEVVVHIRPERWHTRDFGG